MPDCQVQVPAEAASFVASGGRDLDAKRLGLSKDLAPGTTLRLSTQSGDEVGLAVHDPDNAVARVFVVPSDGFQHIDGAVLGWRVERAMAWRRQLGLGAAGSAYRLLHGAGDGVPGLTCDVVGPCAVLYAYSDALLPLARKLATAVQGFAQLDGVVLKLRARGTADEVRQEVVGTSPDERIVATEADVPYEVHPHGGLNFGLFTDMRLHRRELGPLAAGARVLNLFSYTGALSVTCARAGAASVTSVDTSPGVQAWAQTNFAQSGFRRDDKRWKFEVGDAIRFLERARRDREQYDLILIDPPTFSTARGTAWVLGRDYPDLIAQACAVTAERGLLWLASNTYELGALAMLAHKGLRQAKRTGQIVGQGGLPPEYPTVSAQPKDRYLQVCILRL